MQFVLSFKCSVIDVQYSVYGLQSLMFADKDCEYIKSAKIKRICVIIINQPN